MTATRARWPWRSRGHGHHGTARAETAGGAAAAARADIGKTLGFVPQFFLKFPDEMLPGAWDEMKTLQLNPTRRCPAAKELIGLARRRADPLPLLHRRAHRVRQAQRRQRGRDRRGGRDGRHDPPLEHVPERHPDRRDQVPRRDRQDRRTTSSRRRPPRRPPASPSTSSTARRRSREATQMLGYAPEFLQRFPDARPRRRVAPVPRRAAQPGDGALRQEQGADGPGGRVADPVPLLHHRAHGVRQAQRRDRRRRSPRPSPWRR